MPRQSTQTIPDDSDIPDIGKAKRRPCAMLQPHHPLHACAGEADSNTNPPTSTVGGSDDPQERKFYCIQNGIDVVLPECSVKERLWKDDIAYVIPHGWVRGRPLSAGVMTKEEHRAAMSFLLAFMMHRRSTLFTAEHLASYEGSKPLKNSAFCARAMRAARLLGYLKGTPWPFTYAPILGFNRTVTAAYRMNPDTNWIMVLEAVDCPSHLIDWVKLVEKPAADDMAA